MKINFTKAEYKALIELLYLGDWMANAFTIYSNDEPKEYTDLIQKIYSYAKQMGHEEDIEYAKEYDQHFPTQKFEMDSNVTKHIDNYDNESFWTNLIDRLTDRDVCNKHQVGSTHELPDKDRYNVVNEIEISWSKEFEIHGINRIEVVKNDKTG